MTTSELTMKMATFGIAADDIDVVRTHVTLLDARVPDVVAAYYAHLASTDLAPLMRSATISTLEETRIVHWRLLLRGDFAAIREHYSERLGPRLVDGGFPRTIHALAAEWFAVEFARIVETIPEIPRTIRPRLRTALTRFAFLDLALALSTHDVAWLD